jgi:hypothetical protein
VSEITAPIVGYSNRIVSVLRRLAESGAPKLTFAELIEAMGQKSHRLILLLLTLLNMVPGPPGFGGIIAWTMIAVAVAMLLGRVIRLPGIIGDRRLPVAPLLKGSEVVARVSAVVARISRPRLRWMTGAMMTVPYAVLVVVVGLVMVVPIPLINAIPNVGLCIVAFAMLNRDGVALIVGLITTAIGLAVALALVYGVFHLGAAAVGALA